MKLHCNFESQNRKVRSDVYLSQEDDCSIIAKVIPCQSIAYSNLFNEEYSLESVPDSSSLFLKKVPVTIVKTEGTISNPELTLRLSSAELEIKNYPSSKVLIKIYLTNIRYFNCPNTQISVPGQHTITLSPYKRGQITHCAEVSQVNYSDLKNIKQFIESVCWLISFASGNMCSIAAIEAIHNGTIIYKEFISSGSNLNSNEVTKVINDVDAVKFVENTYNDYSKKEKTYLLNNLINIGLLAKNNHYTEAKTLFMVNFLEVLRYNYALNIGCQKNIFKRKRDDFLWVNGSKKNQKASFQEILTEFLNDHGIINSWSNDFKKNRNKVVHQGQCLGNNHEQRIDNYNKLHHFCDRAILAILSWDCVSGHYIPKDQPSIQSPNQLGTNRILFNRADQI
ncbi:MAG: hypothetical protein QNJ32_22860 [Xenococcaceae cyanobacterium MO_167.B27]|nr:hypothetical protein [Xenococcaceae cyanobacterium MO_167.B27]